MNNKEYFEKMAIIQQEIEKYIEQDDNDDTNDNLINFLNTEQILKDLILFKSILSLLSNIAKNHFRQSHFLNKIGKIFQSIKSNIISIFSNSEIFDIFKSQKIILLILIEEKILFIDQSIFDIIGKGKYARYHYPEYFYPEIKQFMEESAIQNILNELPPNFENLRKIGENESKICQIIREDSIQEFIIYINKTNYSLNSTIKASIFETNSFLLKSEPTLIEYATFYGSIQILKYLFLNKTSFSPSLWIYGIHSNNPEVIDILEEKGLKPEDKTYEQCLKESIKCHHNDFANYFLNNYINEKDEDNFDYNVYSYGFHYRNFLYFPKDQNYKFVFYYACKYNYFNIVENFLQNKKFDINATIILNKKIA